MTLTTFSNFTNSFKGACTSGQFFEKKIMKRYTIFSLQMNYYQIDQMHNVLKISLKIVYERVCAF